jgi:hypothetical protein
VQGGRIAECQPWTELEAVDSDGPWTIGTIDERLGGARV